MKNFIKFFQMVVTLVAISSFAFGQAQELPTKKTEKKSAQILQPELIATPQVFSEAKISYEPNFTDAVLYSQMTPATFNRTSQDFEPAYDVYDNQAADDFVVTGGPWNVNALRFYGVYSATNQTPAAGFNIYFYNDNVGLPGTLVNSYLNIAYTEAGGLFICELPSTLVLTNGTYWISIQARHNFSGGGQWFWNANTLPQIGYEGAWQNPGDGFGFGFTTWTGGTTVWGALAPERDFTFELLDAMPQDPILDVDPGLSYNFGNVAIGTTKTETFSLTNIGGGTITVSSIVINPLGPAQFTVTNTTSLPATLPPGPVTFDVNFSPTAAGVLNTVITITHDLTPNTTVINISGKGVVPPSNDDCVNATLLPAVYPQTVNGTTINATPDCFPDYTVWYEFELPYAWNMVSVDFCPTPDELGTGIYSAYPYLTDDCDCLFWPYDFLDWNFCSSDFAPYYEFYWIPGPGIAKLPVTVRTPGGSWEMDFRFILDVYEIVELDLKVYLEGPYNATAGTMNTDLLVNNYIPLNQPYNPPLPYYFNNEPKWLYAGTESVTSVPAGVVDWIYLQLRDASTAANATPATKIVESALMVLSDGSVVYRDGISLPAFVAKPTDNYYAVIYHRNHLGIMSADPLTTDVNGTYVYDFSTSATQVYQGASGYKQIDTSPVVWGMVAADGNGNGVIQNTDETQVWKVDLNASGYLGGDYNMNGIGQNSDQTNYWKPNLNVGGQIPGGKASDDGYASQIPE